MKIIINQPRAAYFTGGAEMISFEHAKNMYFLENEIYYFTIDPKSINQDYSIQYMNFKNEYKDKINFIEINQNDRAIDIYSIKPGEDRTRWNVESIYYNQELYNYLLASNNKFDIIFSYYNLDAVFIPRDLIKVNVLYLCGIPREQNDFQGSFLSMYDKVIAISDEVKESWKKYVKGNINVVTTGVDCIRFKPKEKNNNDTIKLLFVGRIIERKNIDKIIYAYNILKEKYTINLTIVGEGPDKERVEKIPSDAIFTGVVSNPEDYYNDADIFITPSQYGEGLQGTILEAMSMGLTIVATNTEMNNELLSDGRGILIDNGIDDIVNGIEQAININRDDIRNKCRDYVLNNYDWLKKTKEILEVI